MNAASVLASISLSHAFVSESKMSASVEASGQRRSCGAGWPARAVWVR